MRGTLQEVPLSRFCGLHGAHVSSTSCWPALRGGLSEVRMPGRSTNKNPTDYAVKRLSPYCEGKMR